MSDDIYAVNPDTKELVAIQSVSFSDIGIKERADLEAWVSAHPYILGENLLVVTTEYARFDKSKRRLDVLAMDENGCLVVIELKLDAARTFGDLQAIRYAAFCSTMTIDDTIEALSEFKEVPEEEARRIILEFLDADQLPELDNKPRVILAAGAVDDEELTSSVLWLRSFGVDITCVELTPYRIPENGRLILVPKTIIPLPEAKDYIVSVERKEEARGRNRRIDPARVRFWKAVADEFNSFNLDFKTPYGSTGRFKQVAVGHRGLHYEWIVRSRESVLGIALHAEGGDHEQNMLLIGALERHQGEILQGLDLGVRSGRWGSDSAHFQLGLPYEGDFPPIELAPRAASIMRILIERTWPLVERGLTGATGGESGQ